MISFINEVFLCLISWIIGLPFILISLPFLTLLWLYKVILNCVVSLLHPNWTPLNAIDIPCALQDPYNLEEIYDYNIGALGEFEGDVNLKNIQDEFQKNVLNEKNNTQPNLYQYDRLRKIPILLWGHYYWSDDIPKLNIDKQIWERKVEGTDLQEFLKNWINTGYNVGNPLWEMVLYKDNEEYNGKSVLIYKMSHCLGDGDTLQNIITKFHGSRSLQDFEYVWHKQTNLSNLKSNILMFLRGPYIIFVALKDLMLSTDYMSTYPKANSTVAINGLLKLSDIRRIRRAHGCKFNDVLLNIMGNMLRKFMLESLREEQLPDSVIIFQSLMIPHTDKMINQFQLAYVKYLIKCPSKEERFRELCKFSNGQAQQNVSRLFYLLFSIMSVLPNKLQSPLGYTKYGPCCGLSANPSPHAVREFLGKHRIHTVYPITGMLQKRKALAMFFLKRDDEVLEFILQGNQAMFPKEEDLERIVKYLQESLSEMLDITNEY